MIKVRLKKLTALLLAAALTVTGIYFPADPQKAYATEVELTDSATAATTATDTLVYVRSAKELVSALNGETSVSSSSICIEMEEPYGNPKDSGYELSAADVDLSKGIVLPANKDITLKMDHYSLELAGDIVQTRDKYLKLVIPKSSSLNITSETYTAIQFEIENQGTLTLGGTVALKPAYGNGIYNTGSASLEGNSSIWMNNLTSDDEKKAPINNQGGTVLINTTSSILLTDVESANKNTIINKDGNITIEKGAVINDTDGVTGSAILNQGSKAVLEIRGGSDDDYSVYSTRECAIVNDGGKISMVQGSMEDGAELSRDICVYGSKIGIMNYNGGSLDMYEGRVACSSMVEGSVAIATTPYACSYLDNTVSNGSVTMVDGYAGDVEIDVMGIAYSGTSLPVLLGGRVGGINSAVAKYASKGTLAPIDQFEFKNAEKKTIPAYIPAKGSEPAKVLTLIKDGNNPYATMSVSFNGVSVSDFAQLQAALAKGGKIKLEEDITVTSSISLKDGTTLYGNGYKLVISNKGSQVTVEQGAKVQIAGYSRQYEILHFDGITEDGAALVNLGTLSMDNVGIRDDAGSPFGRDLVQNSGTLYLNNTQLASYEEGASASKPARILHNMPGGKVYITGTTYLNSNGKGSSYGEAVYNEGIMDLNASTGETIDPTNDTNGYYDTIHTFTTSGRAITNAATGTITMRGETRVTSRGDQSVALVNHGTFIMEDGYLGAMERDGEGVYSYAILYDENHLPTLSGGRVEGAGWNAVYNFSGYNGLGSAVAKVTDWNTLKTETGSFINPQGVTTSGKNSSRIINGIPSVDGDVYADYNYLLMEKGEVINDCNLVLFSRYEDNPLREKDRLVSTSANVVNVSQNVDGEWVATAVGTGMAMLRLENDGKGISDYIRIDVVEDREGLKGSSYQANLLENNLKYNAYLRDIKIPLEWHLKNSYDATAGAVETDLNSIVEPEKIILESQDPDFDKYFEETSSINFISDTKQYAFELMAKTNDYAEYNYLASSEVNGFSDIRVKLLVTVDNKTEIIDAGTFDLMIDHTEPVFEYLPVTLNSAFDKSASYTRSSDQKKVFLNRANLTDYSKDENVQIISMIYPNGFSPGQTKELDKNFTLSYTGTPKSGNYSVPIKIDSPLYNGYFDATVPVKVINEKPKAELVSAKAEVVKNTADALDIPVNVFSTTEAGVATLSKVEVVGNTEKFSVVNSALDGSNDTILDKKKYYQKTEDGASFYLQPRKELKKTELVTLKFTYKGTTGTYSTTSTMRIVPRDIRKASMKAVNKPVVVAQSKTRANGEIAYGYDRLYFKTTPSNFNGGYFVVSGLNGTGLEAGKVKEGINGENNVKIYAKEGITPGKKHGTVTWYDKDGNTLGKPLGFTVTVQKQSILNIPNKKIAMDYNDLGKMSAKVRYTKTCDWISVKSMNSSFGLTESSASEFVLYAKKEAIDSGAVLPGKTYAVDICFRNSYGESKTETLQVEVADIKNIKVSVADTTLYRKAPYEQKFLKINTTKPDYGMSVANVKITDSTTPFEVRSVISVGNTTRFVQSMTNGQQAEWSIAYKDHQYNSSLIGKQKVKLEITYQNGKKANTEMIVNIK